MISCTHITIKRVHPEVLGIIKPLLVTMEEEDKVLTEEDFLFRCDDLYKRLTPFEKNLLLKSKYRDKI